MVKNVYKDFIFLFYFFVFLFQKKNNVFLGLSDKPWKKLAEVGKIIYVLEGLSTDYQIS